MKKKSYNSILAVLFLTYIGIIISINYTVADKVFSESENRRLEQAPDFSPSQVIDGRYTEKYERYISDQFPIRDFWIGIKSSTEKTMGKKENNGVYLGNDGYLLEKFEEPNEKKLKLKLDELKDFQSNIPDKNIYFMLIPNSNEILKDKLPRYAPNGDQLKIINNVKGNISNEIKLVDVYNSLYENKDKYIYYKTDHHWTTNGAYLAYGELMKAMDMFPNGEEYFEKTKVTDKFYGSLYSKSGFRNIRPDEIVLYRPRVQKEISVEYIEEDRWSDSIYHMENLDKKDKYTVFLDGNHPYIKIKTNVKEDKKLLIIKDSFANSFIPFLTGHFSEIHIIDPRYYKDDIVDLIEEENIDDVLILYSVDTFSKS